MESLFEMQMGDHLQQAGQVHPDRKEWLQLHRKKLCFQ